MVSLTPELRTALSALLPEGRVEIDPEACEPFGADESHHQATTPAAVVHCIEPEDVERVVAWANREGVALTPRGAGTGKAGGAIPQAGAVVLNTARLPQTIDVDTTSMTARVSASVITGVLRSEVEQLDLHYGPDPASLDMCTIGGNIATNAGGPRAFSHGATGAAVLGLDVVLADGRRTFVGKRTVKGVAGLDLCSLLVGSEGTLGVVVGAVLRLGPRPRATHTLMGFFDGSRAAIEAVQWALHSDCRPTVLEFLDERTLALAVTRLPFTLPGQTRAMLLAEVEGEADEVVARGERLGQGFVDRGAVDVQLATDVAGRRRLWAMRREVSYTVKEGFGRFLSEDVAVPLGELGALLDRIARVSDEAKIVAACYGHAGDGNLHVNLLCEHDDQWDAAVRASEAIFRHTIDLGGTISGEHGIGRLKRPYLAWEQTRPLLQAQRAIKKALDPRGILNPGVLFPDP